MLETLALTGTVLYGIASVLAIALLLRPAHVSERWILAFASLGCATFCVALAVSGLSTGRIPAFGRFESITCYGIAVSAAYIHLAVRYSLRGVSAFLLPYVTALLIFGSLSVTSRMTDTPPVGNVWLSLHVLTAFAGYGCFTVASVLAVSYLVQDFNLKHKRFRRAFELLPALETADCAMRRQICFAFALFTLSLVAGIRLAHSVGWQSQLLTDPKIIASSLTWLVYASLLSVCAYSKRHGRRIAWVTVIGLLCILFTFMGIHAVTDSSHNFVLPRATTEETNR